MKIDPTLLGVIVGSALSLIGNFISQWFTLRKEEKQWNRQQLAKDKKREIEDERERVATVKNIYHNCISRLSLIEAAKSEALNISEEELATIHKEVFNWLSLLSLHLREKYNDKDKNFHQNFMNFKDRPDIFAQSLLQEVYELAMSDQILFPNAIVEKHDPNIRRVQMNVDKEYKRQQMIIGIELPSTYLFDCNISNMNSTQRQKLWDQYNGIPQRINLSVPRYNKQTQKIDLKGPGAWEGSINPLTSSPKEIFIAWEKDYDEALNVAKESLEVDQE